MNKAKKCLIIFFTALFALLTLFVISNLLFSNNLSYYNVGKDTGIASYKTTDGISGVNSLQETTYNDDVSAVSNYSSNSAETEEYYDADKNIYNANMSLRSGEYDKAVEEIEGVIDQYNGLVYDSRSSIYDHKRSFYYNVKVPSEELDKIIEDISKIGNVIYSNKSKVNVSDNYFDISERIENLDQQIDNMRALLEQTDNVSTISNIYEEINQLQNQKDRLTKHLKELDKDIAYSNLTISLTDTHYYNEEGIIEGGGDYFSDLIYAFGDSFRVFINIIGQFIIFAVYCLPFAIVGLVAWFLIRKIRKR